MEIRLIYRGQLLATGNDWLKPPDPNRTKDIHRIRRIIHKQLKTLWNNHPKLIAKRELWYYWNADWTKSPATPRLSPEEPNSRFHDICHTEIEALMRQFNKCNHPFVPLVNQMFNTVCGLDILFLRREDPGNLITSQSGGDVDNRIKTLLDALQVPDSCTQVDGLPGPDESPFYTLLQKDALVTELRVTTDRWLEPPQQGENQNDVMLIIQAHIKTSQAWIDAENSPEF